MRKIPVILCLGIMVLPASLLYAHSPQKVVLSYDQNARSLTVDVAHSVADPASHFVDRIEISQNGKMIVQKEPPRQDAKGMSEVYPLTDVKSGDIVKVTAFCNKGGKESGQIRIP